MWVRLILGVSIGLLLLGASFAVPLERVGSVSPRTWLAVAGATTIIGVLAAALALTPIVRAASRLRREVGSSSVWLVQRGVGFAAAIAPFAVVGATSAPNHLVLVADKGGIELWRTVPLAKFASLDASSILKVRVQPGYPRAHLVVDAKTSDNQIVSLMVVPGSERSGPFPASPAELVEIQRQTEHRLFGHAQQA